MQTETTAPPAGELTDPHYIDGVWVSRETLHLLAAAGRVEGGSESGWRWSEQGAKWVAALLLDVALGYYRANGSHERGFAAPLPPVSQSHT